MNRITAEDIEMALAAEPGRSFPRRGRFDSKSEEHFFRAADILVRQGMHEVGIHTQYRARSGGGDSFLPVRMDFAIVLPTGRWINIEIDGPLHDERELEDRKRDRALLAGDQFRAVYRVLADDAYERPDACTLLLAHFERELMEIGTFRKLQQKHGLDSLRSIGLEVRTYADQVLRRERWPASQRLQRQAALNARSGPWEDTALDFHENYSEFPGEDYGP